jgi:hypothetical protein
MPRNTHTHTPHPPPPPTYYKSFQLQTKKQTKTHFIKIKTKQNFITLVANTFLCITQTTPNVKITTTNLVVALSN